MLQNGQLEYIEFESGPREQEQSEGQTIQSLGTLSGMISNFYNWLTGSEEKAVIRLTPDLQPGQMGCGLDDDFKSYVLKLWIFAIQPDSQKLASGS